ncbi:MAG: hypothetical protein KME31_31670 [Tolypothrix carrinoi HA7290-LM1]|nr:hypothetical protein [Tolypothrix carrinoi HA7290-LM1]
MLSGINLLFELAEKVRSLFQQQVMSVNTKVMRQGDKEDKEDKGDKGEIPPPCLPPLPCPPIPPLPPSPPLPLPQLPNKKLIVFS